MTSPRLRNAMFDHTVVDFNELTKAGKTRVTFDCVPIERAAEYAAEGADATLRLWHALKPRLAAEHMMNVYQTLERPLIAVLGAHGRPRHLDRPADAGAAVGRIRNRKRAARRGSAEGCGPAVQSRLAEADRRRAVRFDGVARRHQDQDRRNGRHRRRCWTNSPSRATNCRRRFSTGGRSRNCARPIPTRCRPMSIRRRSACIRITRSPPPRPGGCRHPNRICRTSRSAPRPGARSESAFIARARQQAGVRRLFADRTTTAGGSGERAGVAASLQGRHRHSRDDGVRDVRRAGEGHAGRSAAPRQGDQFRHHLRHLGIRARQPARHRARAKPAITSRSISSASPASATTWTRPAIIAASMAMSRRCSGANAITRTSRREIRRSAPSTNAPRSTRGCRAQPLTSSAARWCAWTMRLRDAGARRRCCCRCMMNWCSKCPTTKWSETLPVVKQVMEDAPHPAIAVACAAAGGRPRRRQLGRGALAHGCHSGAPRSGEPGIQLQALLSPGFQVRDFVAPRNDERLPHVLSLRLPHHQEMAREKSRYPAALFVPDAERREGLDRTGRDRPAV